MIMCIHSFLAAMHFDSNWLIFVQLMKKYQSGLLYRALIYWKGLLPQSSLSSLFYIKYLQIIMEISKKLQELIFVPDKACSQTPCQRYGLDVQKLQIQELFQYRQYRRLYNIVLNDQAGDTVYNFRPHLIKQLYFLLQITPFIEKQLQQSYLSSIEQWYNSNDHKKVKLSKNLQGMLSNVIKHQTKNKIGRPKSSVGWDKNLNCFLRPYTAKLQKNQNKANKQNQGSRPTTSKYTFNKSTCADTNTLQIQDEFQKEDYQTIEDRYDDLCDIEEQWQRSRDFINKHRTVHPEEEPTYQKLMKIIIKADKGQFTESKQQFYSRVKYNQSTINPGAYDKNDIKKRNIYSAVIKRENTKIAAREELMEKNQEENLEENKEDEQKRSNQDENWGGEEEQPEQEDDTVVSNVEMKVTKKIFDNDERNKQAKINKTGNMYTRVNGMRIVRPFTSKQNHVISKLDNYHYLENNKRVIGTLQDEELREKVLDYVRTKGVSSKQLARKTQAKRLISNLKNGSYKNIRIIPSKKKRQGKVQSQKREQNCGEIRCQSVERTDREKDPKFYSVKRIFKSQNQHSIAKEVNKLKTYYKSPHAEASPQNTVNSSSKFYLSRPIATQSQDQFFHKNTDNFMNLAKNHAITSEYRFDPGHKINIIEYNKEILDDIEKIKRKMPAAYKYTENGPNNNVGVSAEALYRALYIDEGVGHVKNIDQYLKMSADKKMEQAIDNKQNDKMAIYDSKYLMLSKGEKKKPKRKRKLKGSKSMKPKK